jgi:hypothetical protein
MGDVHTPRGVNLGEKGRRNLFRLSANAQPPRRFYFTEPTRASGLYIRYYPRRPPTC